MHRIHLDTDFGGDTDDLCALALLLAWPDTQITGITTVADKQGYRAAYVKHVLNLAGRSDVRVASGAKVTLTDHKQADPVLHDERYFPTDIRPVLSEPYASIELTERSMFKDATFTCIGPLTNAAMFDRVRSGLMRHKKLAFMGGYVDAPAEGYPQWGPELDFNIQWDTRAAEELMKTWADLTMVQLSATLKVFLTERDCQELDSMGEIGKLIARQTRAYAADENMAAHIRTAPALPDDFLNFQYDPLTVAVALEWDGVEIEETRVMPSIADGIITWERSDEGRPMRVVTDVDAEAFRTLFLERIATLP